MCSLPVFHFARPSALLVPCFHYVKLFKYFNVLQGLLASQEKAKESKGERGVEGSSASIVCFSVLLLHMGINA